MFTVSKTMTMYTFLFRFDISQNLNGPVSGGLNDCRSLVKLLHWRTADRGDGETPSKRRAREPFGRGEIRESGKPKLAALASHTKGISCTNNKGNVSIPFLFHWVITDF